MADITQVDSEKIRSTVNQLDNIVRQMNVCTNKFEEAIQNLDKGWISEAEGMFMANYQSDHYAMVEMVEQLTEINDNLRNAVGDFEKAENDTLSGVTSLR